MGFLFSFQPLHLLHFVERQGFEQSLKATKAKSWMSEPRVIVTLGAGRVARKPLSRRPPPIQGLSQGRQGMYSDQIVDRTQTTLNDRLGNTPSVRSGIKARLGPLSGGDNPQPVVGKRRRGEDEKWQHDLYNDGRTTIANGGQAAPGDLRSRLNRRAGQGASGGNPGKVKDLREKLSRPGTTSRANIARPAKQRRLTSVVAPTRANTVAAQSAPVVQQVQPVQQVQQSSNQQPRMQASTKSVASFLTSLGLAKYVAAFQAEEVDMAALQHFRDEDFKEMGVPMGPRKKILLALKPESNS